MMNEENQIKYDTLVEEARSKGLPKDWTLELNGKRIRWRSPKPSNRLFDSLSKALAHAKAPPSQLPAKRKSGRMRKKRNQFDDSDTENSTSTTCTNVVVIPYGIKHLSRANSEVSSLSKGSTNDAMKEVHIDKKPKVEASTIVNDKAKEVENSFVVEEEPDTDPETALDCPKNDSIAKRVTTVHWNPESTDERIVGYRIRIFDLKTKKWKEGRILRFDPGSYMHKVSFSERVLQNLCKKRKPEELQVSPKLLSGDGEWMWINEEIAECFGDVVWALVKGFAWWPAQMIHPDKNNPSQHVREGYVLVKFFGTNEVSSIKNVPEFVRPFNHGAVDEVIQKCKKKLNAKAIALAKEEEDFTRVVRDQAIFYYADKAFRFASKKAQGLLGKRVSFFRADINYPAGMTVQGVVRSYSPTSKKWLISFDENVNKPPDWFNIKTHECNLKILDAKKTSPQSKVEDLIPFCFGVSPSAHLSKFYDCCVSCLEQIEDSESCHLECHKCHHKFHSGCLDPSRSNRAAQKVLDDDDTWVCDKCTPCVACRKLDIAFGCKTSINNLELCTMCLPLYEKECYCPNCGYSWDDKKYERTMRAMRKWHKERSTLLLPKVENEVQISSEVIIDSQQRNATAPVSATDADNTQPASIENIGSEEEAVPTVEYDSVDPSWFRPTIHPPVWGFNNLSMLCCDSCNLWVHAGCAQLTEEEYKQTNLGQHPIYSIEFLCIKCCKKRCISIIESLQNEDLMYLFAIPVTEDVAPNYYDIIKDPMDLSTMMQYAQNETYHNYTWLREYFDLMVLNALTFNRPNSKYWNEAKRFHEACLKVFLKAKAAPKSQYHDAILESYKKGEKMLQDEIDRIKQDESTLKKDLVVGASLTKIKVPKTLIAPPGEYSCVQSAVLKLKPKEALFHSWMECCFSCGSSGAPDTMLFCVDCAEAYHAFCVNAPVHSMSSSSVGGWRCPNCKLCEITGVVPEDDSKLLYCEMCDRAFTLDLLEPPLRSVPDGLFICGQCVDCQSCQNQGDKGKVSRKYWSVNPRLCYRCHGCKGMAERHIKGMDCPVCGRLSRKSDTDIIKCTALTCRKFVHASCDPFVTSILDREDKDTLKASFICIKCRKPSKKSKAKIKLPSENTSQDPNSWKILEPHRKDYNYIISDALKLYQQIKARNHMQILNEACPKLPEWMLARAKRYIRIRKRFRKIKDPETTLIIKLYRNAINSASFMVVASHVLGLNILSHAKSFDTMPSFLIAPEKEMGCTHLPNEVTEAGSDEFSFLRCETQSRESYVDSSNDDKGKSDSTRVEDKVSGNETVTNEQSDTKACDKTASSPVNQESSSSDSNFIVAKPLLGWNEILDRGECNKEWRDPRTCVLCHTCGDDDADFESDDNYPNEENSISTEITSSNDFELLDVGKCGRLLPFLQYGQTSWVHTACALWSSEVWENELGDIHAVDKARSRGAKLKCYGCGRSGATLGCHKNSCGSNYHFPCAVACGATFTTNRQVFCRVHRESVESPVEANFEQMRGLKVSTSDNQSDAEVCYRIGTLVVHSLGEIEQDHDGFHSESLITPPGFMASRIFWSYRAKRKRVLYVLSIDRSVEGEPIFSITAADDPSNRIQGSTADKVFDDMLEKVLKTNESLFSTKEDIFSMFPMKRLELGRDHPLLSTSQFWGFGLNIIRQALENLDGIEALVVPLSDKSKSYKFCYRLPIEEKTTELQRKRAAKAAEKDLTNSSGSARTEGMSALDRSGSGRITLALVRHADEELTCKIVDDGSTTSKVKNQQQHGAKRDHDTIQSMFYEMKSIPLDNRLAALRSHIHGWGLFTKVDIPKDSMIIEYTGEIVRQCIADKRERAYEMSGIGSCYMFRLDQHNIVDATNVGCMARFMNHSCCSNAYAKIVTIDGEQIEKKIVVFANKDINAGEEITYDYKFPVEDGSLRCTCGAANCIGRLN